MELSEMRKMSFEKFDSYRAILRAKALIFSEKIMT
jgi:hypothetical protein